MFPFPSNDGMILVAEALATVASLGFDCWWEDGINKCSAATAAVYKIEQSTQHSTQPSSRLWPHFERIERSIIKAVNQALGGFPKRHSSPSFTDRRRDMRELLTVW